MDPEEMSNLDRGPPIYASYQESVHLVKRFQRRRILKIDLQKKRIACGNCLLADPDEMSNLHRGPSIDAFNQVLVHLDNRFPKRRI
jgi:hypothetical protein